MDYLQKTADKLVSERLFAGVEWRVDQGGKNIFAGKSGVQDLATDSEIPENALYRVYSMTKPIISVLALKLIEEGYIQFTSTLAEFDNRFSSMIVLNPDGHLAPADGLITVEHLLTHRAGFSYDFNIGCAVAPYYRQAELMANGYRDLGDIISILSELPLVFNPGSHWRYSVATDVLAYLLETVTQETITELLRKYILNPLEMTDTNFTVEPENQHRVMQVYGVRSLSELPVLKRLPHDLSKPANLGRSHPLDYPEFRRGGYGLFSTISDYMKFANMLRDGKTIDGQVILSEGMWNLMHTTRVSFPNNTFRINDEPFCGYGWNLIGRVMENVGEAQYTTSLGEFGWSGAAATYFWVDPIRDVTGCLMTQYIGREVPIDGMMQTAAMRMLSD
ncbi:beta-lactamase family protein [Paracoccaceae bacterium]|nr:beta-lactamase family protein [Paracoccaceae bacterium]